MTAAQQIFHKLLSLDNFAHGQRPVIHCTGSSREFIMKIRREEVCMHA